MSQSRAYAADRSATHLTMLVIRFGTALIQAAALYGLLAAADQPMVWPATDRPTSVALFTLSLFVPLVVQAGLSQMPARALIIWTMILTLVVASLGYFFSDRNADMNRPEFWPPYWQPQLYLPLFAAIFVAHVLVVDGVAEQRLFPSYSRHFDTAWKLGLQAALALVFVGAFWLLLELCADLFSAIGIEIVQQTIAQRWFIFPATSLALATAIHASDVQPALIRGARAIVLTLFAALLLPLTLVLLVFLVVIAVVSLDPLWATGRAASLLIYAAAAQILLINAAYQDGGGSMSRLKRWATTAACLELFPLVGLAAWAVALRVGQYGWSTDRILAAAIIIAEACYALGYAVAALWRHPWLKPIERTNDLTALVALVLFLALFTPVADPARLMVADQMARLKDGRVTAAAFDYVALRFKGARWGQAAVEALAETAGGPDSSLIVEKAKKALALTHPEGAETQPVLPRATWQDRVTVYPTGRHLPAGFFDDLFPDQRLLPQCLRTTQSDRCVAHFVTTAPGAPETILFINNWEIKLAEADATGHWQWAALLWGLDYCRSVVDALIAGDFHFAPPTLPVVVVGNTWLNWVPPHVTVCAGKPD